MSLHSVGSDAVGWLQTNFVGMESFFVGISHFGDPRHAFLVIFPLCHAFSRNVGERCLWIASLTEWFNAILKWFFVDDRPYWWIKENKKSLQYDLRQFSITCETGPGFPSGHVMSIAAVGLHIVLALKHCIECEERLSHRFKQLMIWTVMASFFAAVSLVAISRVYIATHFPHQVIAAVFIGFLITCLTRAIPSNIDLSGKKLCCVASMSMLLFAFLFYCLLLLLGYDPSITVEFAKKWCKEKRWVHLDTTPFYAVIRDCASLFGLGIAYKTTVSSSSSSIPSHLLRIIVTLLPIQILETINLPTENVILFYCLAYVKFVVLSVIVGAIAPTVFAYLHRIFAWKVVSKIE